MRRTLAIALAVGLLLLGGCGKGRAHQPATPPPPATTATTAPAGQQAPGNGGGDVDRLLDQTGQLLSKDAQAPEDED
ncbi:hypothetical protein ACQP2P_07725 [Dactylosporangium sp. CA-139114]|uniref:hypothetical protein n=1 Tax=Dactylosporangium sp. CA-139114 TaxID=3239931 RepID=UPI003D98111D